MGLYDALHAKLKEAKAELPKCVGDQSTPSCTHDAYTYRLAGGFFLGLATTGHLLRIHKLTSGVGPAGQVGNRLLLACSVVTVCG